MPINVLRIKQFRNLNEIEFSPVVRGLNLITGNNGSGKTSLLEAIHYLGHGRSFRTANANRLINHLSDKFSIYSQLLSEDRDVSVGAERSKAGEKVQRLAEQNASISDLASLLPLRIINSQSHQLFEAGPLNRRKYLDWGIFYQYPNFLECWRNFERVLKQRNALLRAKRPKNEINFWSEELAKHALEFDEFRRAYIRALTPHLCQLTSQLLDLSDLEINYLPGWDESMDYPSILAENMLEDYQFGYTQAGPHRADLDIRINGLSIKHFLSRGQQKLLICAMIIAQGSLYSQHINKDLIYLIDDLPAELDRQSKTKLISAFAQQNMQVFITAIEKDMIDVNSDLGVAKKVFHVEHGNLREKEALI